jgi:hypothetical protein
MVTLKQLLSSPDLDDHCSVHLKYRDLIECGETYERTKFANLPVELETFTALQSLATHILDPVISKFGPIELTYGFGSTELVKRMLPPKRVAPALDQHAAYERNAAGQFICDRLGAACDFLVKGSKYARCCPMGVQQCTPVDRLYFYGNDKPIHVSFSPTGKHQFVELIARDNGRRIPRVVRIP